MNKKILGILTLTLFIGLGNAVVIFSEDFESYGNNEDIDGKNGWEVWTDGWSGWPSGFFGERWNGPYEGNRHSNLVTGDQEGENNRRVSAKNLFSTEGFDNIYFSYARKTDSFEDEETELLRISWTDDSGSNWNHVEEIDEDENYDFKNHSLMEATDETEFGIRLWLRADSGYDEVWIDSIKVTGCIMDSYSCSDAGDCCGEHCCGEPGSMVCSSTTCGDECANEGEDCSSESCCDGLECDYLDSTAQCFSCVSCTGDGNNNYCSSQEPDECEIECGAYGGCDDELVNTTQVVGGICQSCLNCLANSDMDIGDNLCNCMGGTCNESYCFNSGTETCYYGVGCYADGWDYTGEEPCPADSSCDNCPGSGCEWVGHDCTDSGCEQTTHDPDDDISYCNDCGYAWSSGLSCCNGDDDTDECASDGECVDECADTTMFIIKDTCTACQCNEQQMPCDASHHCNITSCGGTGYYCSEQGGTYEWVTGDSGTECGPDEQPPSCTSPEPTASNPEPSIGEIIGFYTHCTDATGTDSFIFSWNAGGDCDTWENRTEESFSNDWANHTESIPPSCDGKNLDFVFYTKDTEDNWGITSTGSITVQGTSAPTTTITGPEEDTWFSQDSVTVNYSTSDPSATTYYQQDNDGWMTGSNTGQITFSGLSEGQHVLRLKNENIAGNGTEDNVTVNIDTQRPTTEISSPANGESFSQQWVLVEFSTPDSDVIEFEYSYDSSSWGDIEISGSINPDEIHSYNFTNVQEGDNTLYIRARDVLGVGSADQIDVEITTPTYSAPDVEISFPQESSVYDSVDVLEFIVTDEYEDELDCEYRLDSESWKTRSADEGELQSISINVPEGDHEIIVVCDNGYKENQPPEKVEFTVREPMEQNLPPTIIINTPRNQNYQKVNQLKFTVTDEENSIDCYYTIDSGEQVSVPVQNGETKTVDIELQSGQHIIEITCSDGQISETESVQFTLEESTTTNQTTPDNETQNQTTDNQTNPTEDYWTKNPGDSFGRLIGDIETTANQLGPGLLIPIIILLILVVLIIMLLLRPILSGLTKKAKKKTETKVQSKKQKNELLGLKQKRKQLKQKLSKFENKEGKYYKKYSKELEGINSKLLKNDEYLAVLYAEAETAVKEHKKGKTTEELKKELKAKGYNKRELALIGNIFTRKTIGETKKTEKKKEEYKEEAKKTEKKSKKKTEKKKEAKKKKNKIDGDILD